MSATQDCLLLLENDYRSFQIQELFMFIANLVVDWLSNIHTLVERSENTTS